jgi:DedD protein
VKERLTGAVILVAILVLLVPELLTGPGPRSPVKPAGAEGAPLRSYTIDLADDAARRTASAPTSAPVTEAAGEPVGEATPEPDVEDPGESAVAPPNDAGASNAQPASEGTDERNANAQPAGSGADNPAATPPQPASEPVEDDRPRSAFGPNAASRTSSEPTSAATSSSVRRPADSAPKPAPANGAAASKGWAVQLGVFASRANADRLAKQVKGKGYAVTVNETSGNGKRLWRVRVGPEAERPAAVALSAKLRAEGHKGATVVGYP